jgi:hypothetical protein
LGVKIESVLLEPGNRLNSGEWAKMVSQNLGGSHGLRVRRKKRYESKKKL